MLFLRVGFRVSERRAIWALGYNWASRRYEHRKDPQDFLRGRICELAANRPSYGYLRIHTFLLREGWEIRVYRLYKQESLELCHKKTRKKISRARVIQPPAQQQNERWSIDFMSDALHNGRRIRVFTIVDRNRFSIT